MKNTPKILPGPIIFGSFLIGVLCALGFRSLTILAKVRPEMVRPVWYFAVIGYIYFFAYRFWISYKRKKVIRAHDLIAKLERDDDLNEEDKAMTAYVLSSLIKSKEGVNYLIIFVLSILAIILDLVINSF